MKPLLLLLSLLATLLLAACSDDVAREAVSPTTPVEVTPSPEAPSEDEPQPAETLDPDAAQSNETFEAARERLVEQGVIGMGIEDETVIEAMRAVPRHEFVPEEYLSRAYANHPLPIGYGQTISQPYIVALMTEAVEVGPDDKVLEIGTGSGYQAAVLAEIAQQVETVEIIEPLADRAREQLTELGYENVAVHHADGYFGWEEQARYDAIVVTAAPDHIPQPLVEQLNVGGKMVIPVGPVGGYQSLWLVTKVSEDEVRTEDLGGVRFVPFTRESD